MLERSESSDSNENECRMLERSESSDSNENEKRRDVSWLTSD